MKLTFPIAFLTLYASSAFATFTTGWVSAYANAGQCSGRVDVVTWGNPACNSCIALESQEAADGVSSVHLWASSSGDITTCTWFASKHCDSQSVTYSSNSGSPGRTEYCQNTGFPAYSYSCSGTCR